MARTTKKPIIGILSMGTMGAGVASLLTAHSYKVLTDLTDRSPATIDRAEAAGVISLPIAQIALEADVFFSILPPDKAFDTAATVVVGKLKRDDFFSHKIAYFDLNAVSPKLSRSMRDVLRSICSGYIDGGIIGGPPKKQRNGTWSKPSIVLSGPQLSSVINPVAAAELLELLNMRYIGDEIGKASGLKMCYASMTKGMTALAMQSYATASQLGVLDELRDHLTAEQKTRIEGGVISMQPKAYRWIREMEEIRDTFRDDGHWDADIFGGVADVYRQVEQTSLGNEPEKDIHKVAEALAKVLGHRT